MAIIRHGDPTRDHYDTAWTVSVLIGLGIAAAIILVAPLTKIYFHEPRSIVVMQCLALRAVLSGLGEYRHGGFQTRSSVRSRLWL